MNKISRFVFNFRSRCNMHCPYCYIPFVDSSSGNLFLWKSIIDKIAQYSPDIVTFGGGDPFAHKEFIDLLHYCQKYSFRIHVDTNAIGLPLNRIKEIGQLVDIIGVPLDGSREQHDFIRNYHGHFDTISASLNALQEFKIPTKINTVYFPEYMNQLEYIARKLSEYTNIKQWFIYEYWHFKGINEYKKELYEAILPENINKLQKLANIQNIHYSSVNERSPAYIFVSSIGNLYTVANDTSQYIELANILDDYADEILSTLQNSEQIDARTKLKQLNHSVKIHKKL